MKCQPQILWCRVIDEGPRARMNMNSVQTSHSAYPYFFFSEFNNKVPVMQDLFLSSLIVLQIQCLRNQWLWLQLPMGPSASILPYAPDLGRVRYSTHRNGFASSGPCGFYQVAGYKCTRKSICAHLKVYLAIFVLLSLSLCLHSWRDSFMFLKSKVWFVLIPAASKYLLRDWNNNR